jgi:hypothetical protein
MMRSDRSGLVAVVNATFFVGCEQREIAVRYCGFRVIEKPNPVRMLAILRRRYDNADGAWRLRRSPRCGRHRLDRNDLRAGRVDQVRAVVDAVMHESEFE